MRPLKGREVMAGVVIRHAWQRTLSLLLASHDNKKATAKRDGLVGECDIFLC